jgi:hypothetical protein
VHETENFLIISRDEKFYLTKPLEGKTVDVAIDESVGSSKKGPGLESLGTVRSGRSIGAHRWKGFRHVQVWLQILREQ